MHLPRLHLRHRFAALGLVGALMVGLPLVQVLRYQAEEIDAVLRQQAALDPQAHALATQRGLLRHQTLARDVLQGRAEREAERRAEQSAVDSAVAGLETALAVRGQSRAIDEGAWLRRSWSELALQVQSRAIDVPASDAGHRLLVEQVMQVMDLVGMASAPGNDALAHAIWRALPQWQTLAALAVADDPGAAGSPAASAGSPSTVAALTPSADPTAATQAAAARLAWLTAHALRASATAAPAAPTVQAEREALHAALAAAATAVADLQSAEPAELRARGAALHSAHEALATQAHAGIAAHWQRRHDALHLQRAALCAALAALALTAAALAAPALRRRTVVASRSTDAAAAGDGATRRGPAGREEAGRLMQRLRTAEAPTVSTPRAPTARPDAAPVPDGSDTA